MLVKKLDWLFWEENELITLCSSTLSRYPWKYFFRDCFNYPSLSKTPALCSLATRF